MTKPERRVSASDCETDPFRAGRTVFTPCCWGIYDGETYREFWGDDATEQFIEYLADPDTGPMEIYAHNGGKFDWLFLKEHFDADISLINGRVARATIMNGKHELRDSYLNMPVPLRLFETQHGEKHQFDYSKLERAVRHKHKREILDYQKQDIVVLYDAIVAWHNMFGRKFLTMASAATNLLRECIKEEYGDDLETLNETKDEFFRQFYFGGRVECFKKGILKGPKKVYDLNSSYPATMRNLEHPISNTYRVSKSVGKKTDFAIIDATSKGALPLRKEDGGIHFPWGRYRFHATGHEIRKALALGILEIHSIEWACEFTKRGTFKQFIDRFFSLRQDAKKLKNALYDLFYKLVMNSSYGKTAIDPRKFTDAMLLEDGFSPEDENLMFSKLDQYEMEEDETKRKQILYTMWRRVEQIEDGRWLWEKKLDPKGKFINVATGASITGGSRANMLQGLHDATNPVYCDTDSVICDAFSGDVDAKRLGAWDLEKEIDEIAIAGKKMYAAFRYMRGFVRSGDHIAGPVPMKKCVKKASKGVALSSAQIEQVALGDIVEHRAEAPTFSLGGVTAVTRMIKNTARIEPRYIALAA